MPQHVISEPKSGMFGQVRYPNVDLNTSSLKVGRWEMRAASVERRKGWGWGLTPQLLLFPQPALCKHIDQMTTLDMPRCDLMQMYWNVARMFGGQVRYTLYWTCMRAAISCQVYGCVHHLEDASSLPFYHSGLACTKTDPCSCLCVPH
jgi:hypothetical protein